MEENSSNSAACHDKKHGMDLVAELGKDSVGLFHSPHSTKGVLGYIYRPTKVKSLVAKGKGKIGKITY